MTPTVPEFLRITQAGVWTRTREPVVYPLPAMELSFHVTLALLHAVSAFTHVAAFAHHMALAGMNALDYWRGRQMP